MRAFALLLLPALAFAGKPEKPEKPTSYESAEFHYRIAFPGVPVTSTKKVATVAGPLPVDTAKVEVSKDLVLSVAVTTYPEAFAEIPPSKILEGVRDGLKGSDGTVKTDTEFEFGTAKHLGRDVLVEAGKNSLRVRMVLVDRRLYSVMLTGAKEKVTAAESDFIKSFELVK